MKGIDLNELISELIRQNGNGNKKKNLDLVGNFKISFKQSEAREGNH